MSRLAVLLLIAALLLLAGPVHAQGETQSSPIDTPPAQLKPGEFVWSPQAVPEGPVVAVISLDEQLAYVYRNGLRIGVTTVSTGKKGKETPTGVFTILQKSKDHRSSLYNSAPMPFMQRLTWDGIALHAGNLPGYPASHGCVRMPMEFAKRLFDVTSFGMTVVVAQDAAQSAEIAHPGVFAPIVPGSGAVAPEPPRLSLFQAYRWTPEKSPTGPLTILVSTSDKLVLVIRNGIEIGRAKISVEGDAPFGTQAYVLLAGERAEPSQIVPERRARLWQTIPMPGYQSAPGMALDPEAVRRVRVPTEFGQQVYDQLQPGGTLVLTDAPVLPKTTGPGLTVLTAEEGGDDLPPIPADDAPVQISPAPKP